jgi:hypothetical protein
VLLAALAPENRPAADPERIGGLPVCCCQDGHFGSWWNFEVAQK